MTTEIMAVWDWEREPVPDPSFASARRLGSLLFVGGPPQVSGGRGGARACCSD